MKTIIFDIGNVLTNFAWEDFFRKFDFSEEVYQKITKATVLSPMWDELDRGVLSDSEIIEGFVKNDPTIEKEIRFATHDLSGILTKRDYATDLILSLKERGFKVLYLSNLSSLLLEVCSDVFDFVPYTDGGVFSFDVKLIKPDKEIYEFLLEKYKLNPDDCYFIDDLQRNIDTACSLGINGILFTSYEEVLSTLNSLEAN